ncbi:MAG TPA: glycosyltransferase family 39 protein [Candidatus Binataceae bacterium]|nr:glycosyltransferase family 39 protein [Candidatus Binataceae bacterium]
MNRFALVVFAIALAVGAVLRFADLGALQMSADEGATWAAADASSVRDVITIQATHNAGKLPFDDLVLHAWIEVFGDGLPAMRSLSSLFGMIAIALMIPATREVFRISHDDANGFTPEQIDSIAAIAALLCAVSLITIKYTREARMYALLLAFAIAQMWVFLRAVRRDAWADYLALALLTAGLVACSLVTASMIATEGIWLMYILIRREMRRAIIAGVAILAGIAMLSPALIAMISNNAPRVENGLVDWLTMPPWWEPAALFNKATGSIAFPVLVVLAIWGIARTWSRVREALSFALLWMWAPPIILVIGSHWWRPMFVERFVLFAFPPFFILIALGLWELRANRTRIAAIAAVVLLSLGHVYEYSRKSHDVDWHAAARVAQATLAPGDTVAVTPAYAVEVVRYYMNPELRAFAVPARGPLTSRIVIVGSTGERTATDFANAYPHVLAYARGTVVRSR